MKIHLALIALLGLALPVFAQEPEVVTLRFLSFPKTAAPEPVELAIGAGQVIKVNTPTNALSEPYKVPRLSTWLVGKMEPAKNKDENPKFTSYGSAASLASSNQLILLIRNGKENKDGMRVIPMDNNTSHFGGGQFFFMNAAKVDIAGMLGGTKFVIKPGAQTIIEPVELKKLEGSEAEMVFTEFYFLKQDEARPFFSSTWPANKKARSMIFFYHDKTNQRLRMHTIRDYLR